MDKRSELYIDGLLAFLAGNLLYCLPGYMDKLIIYYIILFILFRQRRV